MAKPNWLALAGRCAFGLAKRNRGGPAPDVAAGQDQAQFQPIGEAQMNAVGTWERFGIAERVGSPDLVLRSDSVVGLAHAASIRAAFEVCNVDGFFLIDGVPTVVFVNREKSDPDRINQVHRALWNQGLASLLVVTLPDTVEIYSLYQPPALLQESSQDRDRRLIKTLDLAADALEVRNFLSSVESGRYFEKYSEWFPQDRRIDQTLLRNLKVTRDKLVGLGVAEDVARVLVLQIIFIAYLEDREIVESEDFTRAVGHGLASLKALLATCDEDLLNALFVYLRGVFNGDVFHALGQFGDTPVAKLSLSAKQLEPLMEFREGRLEMETGQIRFWPYDFRFVPVELISAIYDRFLNDDRKRTGAYFTPRFLADLVVDQAWEAMDTGTRTGHFRVLDPACGSAIFLVGMFQRMVEDYRRRNQGRSPDWMTLRAFLDRLHGWDVRETAVRVGIFSLYVALLEHLEPPTARRLKEAGNVLPRLLGKTLVARDFFHEETPEPTFDIILGNPPWGREPDLAASGLQWCKSHHRPAPGGDIAWAFVWKAAVHLRPNGRAALLLPAMGVLLNHSAGVQSARRDWFDSVKVIRVINFADVCFQLFENANRPAILVLYTLGKPSDDHKIEYWVPKAHRLLSSTRLLFVPTADRSEVRMSLARRDSSVWKKAMWASARDLKLLQWLEDLPKLGALLITYKQSRKKVEPSRWVIGQGFKPFHADASSKHHTCDQEESVTRYPFLDIKDCEPWVLPTIGREPWPTATVHRRGFVDGFLGPHVLVPQGIIREQGRLRAAYVEEPMCFQHSIQSIRFPEGQERRAKLLTAVLNSSLAAWYFFHTSANFGADRAKVHQQQLLGLPFPSTPELPHRKAAERAEAQIVEMVDTLLATRKERNLTRDRIGRFSESADQLVFEYYGLTSDEQTLVEDTLRSIIPSVQARRGKTTRLMRRTDSKALEAYARRLLEALRAWLRPGVALSARLLLGDQSPAAILEVSLASCDPEIAVERRGSEFEWALHRLFDQLPSSKTRNLELWPDLKVFIGDSLYLAKPLSARYWLPSVALNDADEIAGTLLAAATRMRQ